MKKILTFITTIALSFCFVACDALFDNLEGDMSKLPGDYLASSEAGLSRMMATLYASIPMGAFAEGDKSTDNASDTHSAYVSNSTPSFGWSYGTIRNANVLIQTVQQAFEDGNISEDLCNLYIAEARFVRAYYYFGMVRSLGGVPIITEPLDDEYDGGENLGLYVPRSTEKDTWDFVLSEFQAAADALPEVRTDGPYRATKWAALGLKSRAALYAASVSRYWKDAQIPSCAPVNEKLTYMEESYAAEYYKQCIDASEAIINSGKFSLYNPTPGSVDQAIEGLTELFLKKQDCEYIFGRSFDSGVEGASNGIDLKNAPNQVAFTAQTGVWRFGQYNVNADVADLYDNYTASFGRTDGTIVTRTDGNETEWITGVYNEFKKQPSTAADDIPFKVYDKLADPFANKDARFQAWVIYPGINFRGEEIIIQGGLWSSKGLQICGALEDKISVSGKDYYMYGDLNMANFSGFHLLGDFNKGGFYATGFGLRKFLEPKQAVQYSLNPWYDVRYTEILLNYCEALVETGQKLDEAKKHLNSIRRRAYFLDEVEATLENVLKERRVELMFEDDRSMTLHRRREFYRPNSKQTDEMRTHAIIPVLYGKNGKAQYVFVRAYMHADDLDVRPQPSILEPKNYYGSISNYQKNKITPNPSQVL